MKVSDFDYPLRTELIAQHPLPDRDRSRLMVLDRARQTIEHRHFYDLPGYLRAGDVLVINETKVLPARLYGCKVNEAGGPGARAEFLLLKQQEPDVWEVMVRPGRRLRPGDRVMFGGDDASCAPLTAEILSATPDGERIVRFIYRGIFQEVLSELGEMPLPPYIKEKLTDQSRYQTVYAREEGSAAAPTAGLHFTPELLEKIAAQGVDIARLTLHVGIGTFRPVKEEEVTDHKMHTEYYRISEENADMINNARRSGGRVIAVGTTSTRCLESVADADGRIKAGSGWTDIFIYPGYEWRAVDALITNFHLPKSTLLMLVSSLAGREFIMRAYQEAQDDDYRFFSFGDAMLIL